MKILKNIFLYIGSRIFSYFYVGITLVVLPFIVLNLPDNEFVIISIIIFYFILVIWFYIYITDKFSRKKMPDVQE
jgi:hypothetical protein